jgi:hypothetical protein
MRRLSMVLLVAAGVAPVLLGGCNPLSMGIFTPIPVQPWATERMEEKVCLHTDSNTPILPPIPPGYRPLCEDPPDRRTILRAMPRVTRGVPYVYEEFRDDIDITIEKLADVIDPPRFFPLIGPAQLHHCHYKCTVYYTETIQSSYPFPFKCQRRRSEVVYIDRDHLHLCITTPEAQQSITQDLTTRP